MLKTKNLFFLASDFILFLLATVFVDAEDSHFRSWMSLAVSFFLYGTTLFLTKNPLSYFFEDFKHFGLYFMRCLFAFCLSFIILLFLDSSDLYSLALFFSSLAFFLVFARSVYSLYLKNKEDSSRTSVIIGGGEATSLLMAELRKQNNLRGVVGILDDDPKKLGQKIENTPVIGKISDLSKVVEEKKINEVIISIEKLKRETVNAILDQVDPRKIMVRIIPTEKEVVFKSMSFSQTRVITPEDLLGREEIELDTHLIKEHFKDKTVLIIGAAGSIGSEICYQLLYYPVRRLICVSRGEYSIYILEQRLKANNVLNVDIRYLLGNAQDKDTVDDLMKKYQPDIVFHVAAYKHVPMLENQEKEAIKNNVIATKVVLESAKEHHVKKVIYISTDKAVNPKNIMGASKRMAEIICGYYHQQKHLNVSIVRFGNVLASRGSVIPLFLEQISAGGPVTVTHPEVVRYFMSIEEASLLVINCCAYSEGGEKFILDMGKAVNIDDLVKKMIRLYGYEPNQEIKIKYTGLRPGEKLVEELITKSERVRTTQNKKIFISTEETTHTVDAYEKIEHLMERVNSLSSQEIRKSIKDILPEFSGEN